MPEQKRWKRRPENSTWGDYGANDQLGRMNELDPGQGQAGHRRGEGGQDLLPVDAARLSGRHRAQPAPASAADPPVAPRRQAELALPRRMGQARLRRRHQRRRGASCTCSTRRSGTRSPTSARCSMPTATASRSRPSTTATAAASTSSGRPAPRSAGAVPGTIVEAKGTSSGERAGRREHGGQVPAGARRHDRPVRPLRPQARMRSATTTSCASWRPTASRSKPGDFVLLRTGFDEVILEGKKKPDAHALETSCTGLDGGDRRLQQWITESRLVALISDNYAVELMPTSFKPGDCVMLPLHHHCLFKTGVNLGEIWRLSELADWLRKQQPQPLPAHRAATAAAGGSRLAGNAGCDGVTAALRTRHLRWGARRLLNPAKYFITGAQTTWRRTRQPWAVSKVSEYWTCRSSRRDRRARRRWLGSAPR